MKRGKRNSFDIPQESAKALAESIKQDVDARVFMTGKLQSYIMVLLSYKFYHLIIFIFKAKAEKLGVLPSMMLASMLSSISNVMNMSEVLKQK